MLRVGDEELAAQLPATALLVARHQDVDHQRRQQGGELDLRQQRQPVIAGEPVGGLPHQLEAGDREKADDREGAERLELTVPVGVVLVRGLGRHAHHDEREHVVQGVDAGVQGVAEDGERVSGETDGDFRGDDDEVGDQQAEQHATDTGEPVCDRGPLIRHGVQACKSRRWSQRT